jgi:predicted kinase
MKPTVYTFRGAPASGKDTLTHIFCELLPKPVALISQDVLRFDFHGIGRDVMDIDASEHVFANENAELLYERYLKDGRYTIVFEGSMSWDDNDASHNNVMRLIELATQYGFTVKSIILKASMQELLKRNAERSYAVPHDKFAELYEIYKDIDPSEIIIDSTGQTPEETLTTLKKII